MGNTVFPRHVPFQSLVSYVKNYRRTFQLNASQRAGILVYPYHVVIPHSNTMSFSAKNMNRFKGNICLTVYQLIEWLIPYALVSPYSVYINTSPKSAGLPIIAGSEIFENI
jgi:hypothetical protein